MTNLLGFSGNQTDSTEHSAGPAKGLSSCDSRSDAAVLANGTQRQDPFWPNSWEVATAIQFGNKQVRATTMSMPNVSEGLLWHDVCYVYVCVKRWRSKFRLTNPNFVIWFSLGLRHFTAAVEWSLSRFNRYFCYHLLCSSTRWIDLNNCRRFLTYIWW